MKSSNNILSQAEADQILAWSPTNLHAAPAPELPDGKRAKVAAIFKSEPPSASESTLHKQGKFDVWDPPSLTQDAAHIPPADWEFSQTAERLSATHLDVGLAHAPELYARQGDWDAARVELLTQARAQAEEMLINAQVEADNILLQAEEEIAALRTSTLAESRQQVAQEIGATLEAAQALMQEVSTWKENLIVQGEPILVDMLKEIAQKLFGEGVALDPEALQINLNHVMESVNRLGDLNVFLNPQDAKILDPAWSKYQSMVLGNEVKIIPSDKITRGGCYIKGSMGIVDGRVETQLNAMLNVLDDENNHSS